MVKRKIWNRVNWFFTFLLIPLGFLIIDTTLRNYSMFLFFFLIVLIRYLDHRLGWKLKEWHFSYILLIFLFSLVGDNFLMLYIKMPIYDKLLHFCNPLFVTIIIASSTIVVRKFNAVPLSLAIATLVEILEFFADYYYGTLLQGVFFSVQYNLVMTPLVDTMLDLTLGLLGSLVGYLFYMLYQMHLKNKRALSNHVR